MLRIACKDVEQRQAEKINTSKYQVSYVQYNIKYYQVYYILYYIRTYSGVLAFQPFSADQKPIRASRQFLCLRLMLCANQVFFSFFEGVRRIATRLTGVNASGFSGENGGNHTLP